MGANGGVPQRGRAPRPTTGAADPSGRRRWLRTVSPRPFSISLPPIAQMAPRNALLLALAACLAVAATGEVLAACPLQLPPCRGVAPPAVAAGGSCLHWLFVLIPPACSWLLTCSRASHTGEPRRPSFPGGCRVQLVRAMWGLQGALHGRHHGPQPPAEAHTTLAHPLHPPPIAPTCTHAHPCAPSFAPCMHPVPCCCLLPCCRPLPSRPTCDVSCTAAACPPAAGMPAHRKRGLWAW